MCFFHHFHVGWDIQNNGHVTKKTDIKSVPIPNARRTGKCHRKNGWKTVLNVHLNHFGFPACKETVKQGLGIMCDANTKTLIKPKPMDLLRIRSTRLESDICI